jgi:hypothetical protein
MGVAIVDGLGRPYAKACIDTLHSTLHLHFDLAIVLDLRTAGHRDLHEAEASLILWILLEEPLDGLKIEVTQGPQGAMGKASVKPVHLGLAQPHTP